MKTINEIIDNLTHNGKYANEICLMLLLSNLENYLYYLDSLNISGKELETLANTCCKQDSIEYLTQTIQFLKYGYLSMKEIKDNLNSPNPVIFIDRLLKKGENYLIAYEDYAGNFRMNIKNNNKSR